MMKNVLLLVMILCTSFVSAGDADLLRFDSKLSLNGMRTLIDSSISNDGKKLVVGTRDGRVIIWDIDSNKKIFERKYPKNVIKSLAFANTTNLVAISLNKSAQMKEPFESSGGTEDNPSNGFHVIDFVTGATYGSNMDNARKIKFFPEDDMIGVVHERGKATVYYTDDLSEMASFSANGEGTNCITSFIGIASDNTTIAVADNCHTVSVYDVFDNFSPQMIFNLRRSGEAGKVSITAMETSGDLLAVAKSNVHYPVGSHFVDVYDLITGRKRSELHPHDSNVNGLDIVQLDKSDKDFMLISGSRDRTVKITNPNSSKKYRTFKELTQIKRVGITGDRLYYADVKGNINIFERYTLKCESSLLPKLVKNNSLKELSELEGNCSNLNYEVRDIHGASLVKIAYDNGHMALANKYKQDRYGIDWKYKSTGDVELYTEQVLYDESLPVSQRMQLVDKMIEFGFVYKKEANQIRAILTRNYDLIDYALSKKVSYQSMYRMKYGERFKVSLFEKLLPSWDLELIKLFFKHEISTFSDLYIEPKIHTSPILKAWKHGKFEIVEYLIKHKYMFFTDRVYDYSRPADLLHAFRIHKNYHSGNQVSYNLYKKLIRRYYDRDFKKYNPFRCQSTTSCNHFKNSDEEYESLRIMMELGYDLEGSIRNTKKDFMQSALLTTSDKVFKLYASLGFYDQKYIEWTKASKSLLFYPTLPHKGCLTYEYEVRMYKKSFGKYKLVSTSSYKSSKSEGYVHFSPPSKVKKVVLAPRVKCNGIRIEDVSLTNYSFMVY